jgi:putative hydrolase of HD superfamily
MELRTLWEEFEHMATPEARYASALDRLLPFMSNAATEGYTWVKYGVTAEQIYRRMEPVRLALPGLWSYITETVEEAQKKGYVVN